MKPYAQEPEDLRPYSKFTQPYYQHYTDLVEYNGAARDIPTPDLKDIQEVRIGFIGPLENHPEQAFGQRMLHGVQMAIDEANAAGGYCGKPYKLMLHNDSAVWGASSNEVVKMAYDDKVWAMFGSISGDTTHIALRVSLRSEVPMINSASTDPTIPETLIPWYFTDLQDDRVQGYTLARHIYTELGLKRVALLRVNDRYGRFGVLKFKDASRRLGRPVVIEQKFMQPDTDFRRQLRVIADSRADAIVLWTDQRQAAAILQQMHELGMKQRVFGSHRTLGDELLQKAGADANGFEAVFPYDPTRKDARWEEFNKNFMARYNEKPDQFASLAYDAMQALIRAICQAGLNRGRIRDVLTGITEYKGVTGDMVFDPNCKNVAPLFFGTVRDGHIEYRRATMEKVQKTENAPPAKPENSARPENTGKADKPYARVGEDGVNYFGPAIPDEQTKIGRLAVVGPNVEQAVKSSAVTAILSEMKARGRELELVPVSSEGQWGKATTALVQTISQDHVLGVITLDRASGHLAEQLGVKLFVPVVAISSDKTLTSVNIPWIFRLPQTASLDQAVQTFSDAYMKAGANRGKIRDVLASGDMVGGVRFQTTGELRQ
jgi:ABC-type branched-subunit amino acid transport system substrate-binding protein